MINPSAGAVDMVNVNGRMSAMPLVDDSPGMAPTPTPTVTPTTTQNSVSTVKTMATACSSAMKSIIAIPNSGSRPEFSHWQHDADGAKQNEHYDDASRAYGRDRAPVFKTGHAHQNAHVDEGSWKKADFYHGKDAQIPTQQDRQDPWKTANAKFRKVTARFLPHAVEDHHDSRKKHPGDAKKRKEAERETIGLER